MSDKIIESLEAIISLSMSIAKEATDRKADLKQARIAIDAIGQANAGIKNQTVYRLNRERIVASEAKLINQSATAVPAKEETKAITDQKAA